MNRPTGDRRIAISGCLVYAYSAHCLVRRIEPRKREVSSRPRAAANSSIVDAAGPDRYVHPSDSPANPGFRTLGMRRQWRSRRVSPPQICIGNPWRDHRNPREQRTLNRVILPDCQPDPTPERRGFASALAVARKIFRMLRQRRPQRGRTVRGGTMPAADRPGRQAVRRRANGQAGEPAWPRSG